MTSCSTNLKPAMLIKYLPVARSDLRDIGDHFREVGGNILARRMVGGIRADAAKLADNPKIAPPYELATDLHCLVVAKGTFLVFYRVVGHIEVIHIRRAERQPVTADELEN
jgi:plasmid stabilization system protein ParE